MSEKQAVNSTEQIARRHGHAGPATCQDCGTDKGVHFGSWFHPESKECGQFFLCCPCGIRGGDRMSDHADCGTPLTALLPHEGGDVASKAAYASILDRAIQAYTRGHEEALRLWRLEDEGLHQNALAAVLPNVGTAFAAAALLRAARLVSDKGSAAILEGLAAELDLQVVESLEGTSEDTTLPRGET